LDLIKQVIQILQNGDITKYRYDPQSICLIERK
jgi:hypothetical protein